MGALNLHPAAVTVAAGVPFLAKGAWDVLRGRLFRGLFWLVFGFVFLSVAHIRYWGGVLPRRVAG